MEFKHWEIKIKKYVDFVDVNTVSSLAFVTKSYFQ